MNSIIKSNNKNLFFPSIDTFFDDIFTKEFFNKKVETGTTIPAANITESKDKYSVELAVPGIKKEDIQLNLDGNILYISSETKSEKSENDTEGKVTRKEYSFSSFKRGFNLPDNIEQDKISAKYDSGILKIEIPKKEIHIQEANRKIEIS